MSGDCDEGEHALLLKVDAVEDLYGALRDLYKAMVGSHLAYSLIGEMKRAREALEKAEGRRS